MDNAPVCWQGEISTAGYTKRVLKKIYDVIVLPFLTSTSSQTFSSFRISMKTVVQTKKNVIRCVCFVVEGDHINSICHILNLLCTWSIISWNYHVTFFFSLTLNWSYTLAATTSWKLVAISLGDDDTVFNVMFNWTFSSILTTFLCCYRKY